MQKLSLEYYLCMTCYNANHCNYLTQVYQVSMTDYLIFLPWRETIPLTLLRQNTGVSTVIKCMHLVSNVESAPGSLQPNDGARVSWEKRKTHQPDSQDSTENGNHMPKVKYTHC